MSSEWSLDAGLDLEATAGPQWSRPDVHEPDARPWETTKLYQKWRKRVQTGRPNDLVIVVTPSSWTGVSGSGKTTAATALAKSFDITDEGFDGEKQSSLDAAEMAYKVLPTAETGSALIFDEAQGAPGTNSVNARRGMKSSSMDAMNGILANRDMRFTVVIVAQQLGMLDKNLYPMIDAWLLIRREPDMPDGPLMTYYNLHVDDYDLGNPQIKVFGVEDLTWPRLPNDDPDYKALELKKQRAKQRGGYDSDEGEDEEASGPPIPDNLGDMPTEYRDPIIKDLRDRGVDRTVLSEASDVSPDRISQIAPQRANQSNSEQSNSA